MYPSNLPQEEIFENLAHNWMDERDRAIAAAAKSALLSEIKKKKYQMQRNDDDSVGSDAAPLPHELDLINNLRQCHSLFWPMESKKEVNGICPFTEANRCWLESSRMSELVQSCNCTDGYDLNIVDMIMHLQSHSHWVSRVASLTVMEHDICIGMHPLRGESMPIQETTSPHQPQELFRPKSNLKTTGGESDSDDEPPRATLGKRRNQQILAGIPETSSSEKESNNDSDSDTASESKRYKAAQEVRYKKPDRSPMIRKKEHEN